MGKYTIILGIFIVLISIFLSIYREYLTLILDYTLSSKSTGSTGLFTPEQLQKYNGVDNPELYLAILGNVFDVTRGKKHYGPGETYNVFAGRDGSRSFITGKFTNKDLSDDVIGLTNQQLISLNNWLKFYKKEYDKVGKIIGRYYDESGRPTQYCKEIKKLIELAENEKESVEMEKFRFPPCNVEWTAESGSRVWCTKRSGGIERDWIGVPRKLYEAGSDSYRCACISNKDNNLGNLKEYEGCDPNFASCYVRS